MPNSLLDDSMELDAPVAPSRSNTLDNTRLEGDTGQLLLDTRRALVHLLRGPAIDIKRHAILWGVLLRDQVVITSRLHELFLDLVVDTQQGVGFTRQMTSEEVDIPILLRKKNLTFLESVLVIFLRQRITQADAQDERAVVSLTDMQEHLQVFEQTSNTDEAKFRRACAASIERMKKLNLLHKLGTAEERFEVSPTLKLLFTADDIQALTKSFVQPSKAVPASDDTEDDEDSE
jgi:hypothetical protein